MADEMFDDDSDVVGAEEAQGGEKRVGFLSGVLIQVLKWVSQTRILTSEEYRAESPIYSWFEQIGELRGSTGDEVRTTYIVEPFLGYDGNNESLITELIDRRIQLIGIFNDYFGSRTVDELQGQNNKVKVEQELKDQINRIMRSGRVDEIVFGSYQFLPF